LLLRREGTNNALAKQPRDPRQIDLLAILALLIVIATTWRYFGDRAAPHNTTAFIEPSQSVRW
jgi:hypothetical protein